MSRRRARRVELLNASTIREILKITERPGIISLGGRLAIGRHLPGGGHGRGLRDLWRARPRRPGVAALSGVLKEVLR